MTLIDKVKTNLLKETMLEEGNRVVVAVSGGPDSVFLLYTLNELRHSLSIDLFVAHFDHRLRKDSGADARFVSSLAKSLHLPYCNAARNTSRARQGGSVEEMARQARMKFLINTAKQTHADKIALGHTQDDLAETVLLRLIRGTGLYGLRAICPVRDIDGTTFIRPLLNLTKPEIVSFLKKNKMSFRIDPSNQKTEFFRNKIRLKLLPILKQKYNPEISKSLASLANTASVDYEYLESETRRALRTLRPTMGKNRIAVSLHKLRKLHLSLRRMIFRLIYEKLNGDTRRLTLEHIESIERIFQPTSSATPFPLPNNIFVSKKGVAIIFARRNA